MTKITSINAVQELFDRIPGFKNSQEFDEYDLTLPTVVFDKFGDYLLAKILSSSENDSVIIKSFDFINEMQDSADAEVKNLAQVGVFEVLAGLETAIGVSEKLLNKNGLEWFLKIKQNFKPQN